MLTPTGQELRTIPSQPRNCFRPFEREGQTVASLLAGASISTGTDSEPRGATTTQAALVRAPEELAAAGLGSLARLTNG